MAKTSVPYLLCRVHPDGREEKVSEHPTFEEGWSAGTHLVTVEDKKGAYSLYKGERRIANFGHARLMLRRDAASVRSNLNLMGVSDS